MARRVFFSFHYKPDSWRAAQVRNAGVVEGNSAVSDNKWEEIANAGDDKIKEWINDQIKGRSCAIVLIGRDTAGRKWIKYEITEAWNANKGVLGIHIHNLKDQNEDQTTKGRNPFSDITVSDKSLSNIVKTYDPPYKTSTNVYNHIKENIADWVEDAINIRSKY